LSKERFDWVDYSKAFGIVLVVYGHVARGLVNSDIMVASQIYKYVDSVIYTFHMPLFFFLPGLFLLTSFQAKGPAGLFGSKLDTIVYPYILWSLLQGTMEVALSSITNGDVSLARVLSLFVEPRAQFWFLYALFLIYIVIIPSLFLFRIKSLLLLLMISVFIYFLGLDSPDSAALGFISNNFVFFLMGAAFQQLRLIRFNSGFMLLALASLSIAGQLFFHKSGYNYLDKGGLLLALSVVSLLAVVSFSSWLTRFGFYFMAYVGSSSMAIYLMHIIAGSGARVILDKFLGVESLTVHLSLGVLLGLFLPLIAVRIAGYFRIPYLFSFPISQCWVMISKPK
jgi:fucose 4-O-acetylase-like acetyltransferase